MAVILAKRDIVIDKQGNRYRLLRHDPREDTVHVISLSDPTAWPLQWQMSQLQLDVVEGRFSQAESTSLALISGTPGDAALRLQTRRWSIIEGIAENPAVLFRAGRKTLIAAHAKAVNASATTVRTCLRLYWQGGMTKDALLPDFDQCGTEKSSDGERPSEPNKKRGVRGRLRKDEGDKFYVSPELSQEIAQTAKAWLKDKTATRKTIYKKLCVAFKWAYLDADNKTRLLPSSERPSRRQVSYAINKRLTAVDKLKRAGSPMEFENNHAPKLGSVLQECRERPGAPPCRVPAQSLGGLISSVVSSVS
jgi:putative transposase